MSEQLRLRLVEDFSAFGLLLSHLYITSITPPEEVQSAIDDRSRMAAIGDLDRLLKMKTAMAMEKAATTQGEAGSGLGLGLGMLLPNLFAAQTHAQAAERSLPTPSKCPDCKHEIGADARFCPYCGHQVVRLMACNNCGKNLTPKAHFCSQCGRPTSEKMAPLVCPQCRTENLPGALYCNDCGTKLA